MEASIVGNPRIEVKRSKHVTITYSSDGILNNQKHYTFCFQYYRSSHPEVFCKKGVLSNFAKFTGKHLFQCFFFNEVAGLRPVTLLKRNSGTGVFL